MSREALQPDGVAVPAFPYSPVVLAGDLVYTAGQVALDAQGALVAGGIEEQTRRTLENVAACLAAAACTLADVVKVNAFLADLDTFAAYNEVYSTFFDPPYPARTTVGVDLPAGILVEIEAVARRPS